MPRNQSYNWEPLRYRYVTGDDDVTLFKLSREHTGDPDDPPYQTVRRESAKKRANGTWTEQRAIYRARLEQAALEEPEVQAVQEAAQQAVTEARQRLSELDAVTSDVTQIVANHFRLAESLKHSYAAVMLKMRTLLNHIDDAMLQSMSRGLTLKEITSAYRDLAAILQTATDLERKALGLTDQTEQDLTTQYVISLDTDETQPTHEDLESAIEKWSQQHTPSLN